MANRKNSSKCLIKGLFPDVETQRRCILANGTRRGTHWKLLYLPKVTFIYHQTRYCTNVKLHIWGHLETCFQRWMCLSVQRAGFPKWNAYKVHWSDSTVEHICPRVEKGKVGTMGNWQHCLSLKEMAATQFQLVLSLRNLALTNLTSLWYIFQ